MYPQNSIGKESVDASTYLQENEGFVHILSDHDQVEVLLHLPNGLLHHARGVEVLWFHAKVEEHLERKRLHQKSVGFKKYVTEDLLGFVRVVWLIGKFGSVIIDHYIFYDNDDCNSANKERGAYFCQAKLNKTLL